MGSRYRLEFLVPSRGLFGYRNEFLTDTRGEGVMSSVLDSYAPMKGEIERRQVGSLVAFETGEAVAYGLAAAQERGALFIGPGTSVYAGMVVGVCSRNEDMTVNVCKKKQLTNMRAAGSDEALRLTPPHPLSGAVPGIPGGRRAAGMHAQEPAHPQAGAGSRGPYAQSDEEARSGQRLNPVKIRFLPVCVLLALLLMGCGHAAPETTAPTLPETQAAATQPTQTSQPETLPTETQPTEEHFLLTFAGTAPSAATRPTITRNPALSRPWAMTTPIPSPT